MIARPGVSSLESVPRVRKVRRVSESVYSETAVLNHDTGAKLRYAALERCCILEVVHNGFQGGKGNKRLLSETVKHVGRGVRLKADTD